MIKPRKSLKNPRHHAFVQQKGLCYYCGQPMWVESPQEITSKLKITSGQAKSLLCTGEHLTAHQDGGNSSRKNIVAACLCCNQRRHKRRVAPTPENYKALIKRRLEQGRWHNFVT